MHIDIDYELFDESITETRSPSRRSRQRMGGQNKIERRSSKERMYPDQVIEEYINKLRIKFSKLPPDEQDQNMRNYFEWVRLSLQDGYPFFEQNDLEEELKHKLLTIKHKPTQMYGLGIEDGLVRQRRDAEIKLFDRLDRHIKLWKKTTQGFKEVHLDPHSLSK